MEFAPSNNKKDIRERDPFVQYKFGLMLEEARRAQQLKPSVNTLARLLGIKSYRTLENYENGLAFPPEEKLEDFIRVYHISPENIPRFRETYEASLAVHNSSKGKSPIRLLRKEERENKRTSNEDYYPPGLNTVRSNNR